MFALEKIKASNTLKDFSKIQKEIENLRQKSKDTVGYGYQVEFIKRNDQKSGGSNLFLNVSFLKQTMIIWNLSKRRRNMRNSLELQTQ